MMNTPFFSIIVPVYNMADYLPDCVNSILSQTYDDWELILVDDGSSDKSPQMCDDYAKNDNRIKVIHKENGGEFSARLAGINNSGGEYVTGIDPDDYCDVDYLQTIKTEIDKCNCDCIMWSFSLCGEREGKIPLDKELIKEYKGSDYLLMVIQTTLHSFCSKAIRLKALKQTDFSEVPKVRMSEDYIMVIPTLCNIMNAKVIDYYGYKYRIRKDSASNSVNYQKLIDMCEVSKYGLKVMREHHFESDEYILGEAQAFIRSIVPRMWQGLEENTVSEQEIRKILIDETFTHSINIIDDSYRKKYKIDRLFEMMEQ